MQSTEVQRVAIGVIRKPHGVKGGLKVTLFSLDLDQLQELEQLFVNRDNTWVRLTQQSCQGYADYAIIRFNEIADRTEAETYQSLELFAEQELLPEPTDGEFYIKDLLTCQVVDQTGQLLGPVTDVLTPGAHEVLVIGAGATEVMVPLVSDWVIDIDLDQHLIQVHAPEELN